MLFLSSILGFIVWVGWGSYGNWNTVSLLLILPLGAFLFFRGKGALFFLLWMIGILLGWYHGYSAYHAHMNDWREFSYISSQGTQKVAVQGTVSKVAYNQDQTTTYRLKIDTIDNISTGENRNFREKNIAIFVRIPRNLTIQKGDQLTFTGKLSPTITPSLDGFERYAFFHGAYGSIFLPTFSRVPSEKTSWFDSIREWSIQTIWRGFPRAEAWVILGMMIGSVELLSSEIKEAFILSGTSHILVVSGSNIAFVILLITGILRYLPVRKSGRIVSVVLFVIFYSTLVWWDTSVLRATFMGILTFFAIEHGKKVASIIVLFTLGTILLIANPLSLAFDAGFGLSFIATMGILLYYEPLSKWLWKTVIPKVLFPIIGVTLAASLGSLPVLIYHFGVLPIGSLVANILIAWVLGWILMTGVFYLIFGIIGWYFLYLFGFLVYFPVKYVLLVSQFFALSGTLSIPENWQIPLSLGVLWFFLVDIFVHEAERLNQSQKASKHP
jgi:competence protein ComEC